MKELGAEVTWQTKTTAKVTYGSDNYILDTENCTFIKEGTNNNLITIAPGAIRYYEIVGNEFFLDDLTTKYAINWMHLNAKINIDYNNKVVSIK